MIKPFFTPIEASKWERAQIFHYFSQIAPTSYCMTVEVDITKTLNCLKARVLKFFPAYLWLVTTALNEQQNFKIALCDGKIGYWNSLTPLYATFHEDDKTISLMFTEYDNDFDSFYKAYIGNKQKYSSVHGVLSQAPQLPPPNSYTVSCIPWIGFKSFSLCSQSPAPYYFPTVEAGKFFEQSGRTMMPLSITAHHATTDGWQIKCFLDKLNLMLSAPESWVG